MILTVIGGRRIATELAVGTNAKILLRDESETGKSVRPVCRMIRAGTINWQSVLFCSPMVSEPLVRNQAHEPHKLKAQRNAIPVRQT